MNKLRFLFFLSIFGCIKFERLEERDKVFSYDDFRKLVKKEDIAEYLSKNEYDFKQELEQGRDILNILITKDMEIEVLVLLDKLNTLKAEERVKFLSISDEKVLHLVFDKLWVKSTKKILEMYSNQERLARLGFISGLNFALLGRAVMNKNMKSLLLVLDLRREYAREIKDDYVDSCTFKINKKLSESLEKAYDLVTARKADKASEVDKNIGEDSIVVTFLKECLKKKGIKGEVSIEEFLSNLEEEEKKEALIISICLGDERVLSYLLNLGVKRDEVDKNGNTALIYSSYYGRKEISKVLIESGVEIDLGTKGGITPLWIASKGGHKEVVELLINKGASIDLATEDGVTPLFIASSKGHKEVVELLLTKGARINLVNQDGWMPLLISSQEGHKEIVELLIEKGAEIDSADKDGWTPLLIASHEGHKEVVELLLTKGAAINLGNENGTTPLLISSQEGKKEVVELLINKGAEIDLGNKNGTTPLLISSQQGHKEVVELLLTKEVGIDSANKNGTTPLLIASSKGHKEVVELLINKGAAIDLETNDGVTPLYIASSKGHKEVVALLLKNGANVNKINLEGKSVLEAALLNKKEEVIEELLSSCFVEGEGIVLSSSSLIVSESELNLFNPEIRRNSISLTVSFSKIYRILNEIYSNQFIREVETDFGKSSTTLAEIMNEVTSLKELNIEFTKKEVKITDVESDFSKRAKYEVCEIIDNLNKMFNKRPDLRAKAVYNKFINSREVILNRRVKAGYYKNFTILMLEILKGNLDRVKELIKEGADVNAADQSGNTCLTLAVRRDLKEIVELLINNGADIKAVNKSGENALMIAVEANSVDMVKRLVPLTDINHEDIFKNTSLMLAIKKIVRISPESSDSVKIVKDIEEIVDILIKSGAKVTEEVMDLLKDKKEDEVLQKFCLRLARLFKLNL